MYFSSAENGETSKRTATDNANKCDDVLIKKTDG